MFNSLPASSYFCRLLITFAKKLDAGQARQNIGPDLDPSVFDTLMIFLKEIFFKVNLKTKIQTTKKHALFENKRIFLILVPILQKGHV